jgi:hypothetical protein
VLRTTLGTLAAIVAAAPLLGREQRRGTPPTMPALSPPPAITPICSPSAGVDQTATDSISAGSWESAQAVATNHADNSRLFSR